jgi:hypothetical protein
MQGMVLHGARVQVEGSVEAVERVVVLTEREVRVEAEGMVAAEPATTGPSHQQAAAVLME